KRSRFIWGILSGWVVSGYRERRQTRQRPDLGRLRAGYGVVLEIVHSSSRYWASSCSASYASATGVGMPALANSAASTKFTFRMVGLIAVVMMVLMVRMDKCPFGRWPSSMGTTG